MDATVSQAEVRRPRIRGRKGRIAKWCGLVACVLIVGVWAASRWFTAGFRPRFAESTWIVIECNTGCLAVGALWWEGTGRDRDERRERAIAAAATEPTWLFARNSEPMWRWRFRWG